MPIHRSTRLVVAGLAVGATALSGAAVAAQQAPAAKPAVRIVTPKLNVTTGNTVMVKVALKNFTIDAKHVGMAAKPNRGHIHFQLDKGKFDFPKYSGANGRLAVKLGTAGTYSPAVTPTITYRNLPKGKHTLTVFLASNDHKNGAKATTTFRVR
jgi:hypothetical protein